MAKADFSALEADLGQDLNRIDGLQGLDQSDVDRLQGLVKDALRQQSEQIAEASEEALQHVPALLRGTLRKLLFR